MADRQRPSIPSMVDGLTPDQRKILFYAFKRNLIKETRVSHFAGYVEEQSAYSLADEIVEMAQDFVGSNNINLFCPFGQFGTRHMGGVDNADPIYIFTKLSPITPLIFPKDDDEFLNYLKKDGKSIEPTWYVPILPLVLVNGAKGTGGGVNTYIPKYNPRDVVSNLRRLLNDECIEPMHPWYRGFKGSIDKKSTSASGVIYTVAGVIEAVDSTTLRISELPINCWTEDYKNFLEKLEVRERFIEAQHCNMQSYSNDIDIKVILREDNMNKAIKEGLEKKFKLSSTVRTTKMHLIGWDGKIRKFDTPEKILEEFFKLRLGFYEKRKKALLDNIELHFTKLDNKVRFIRCIGDGEIKVNNRTRLELLMELEQKNFNRFPKISEESPKDAKGVNASNYDYLLTMPIGTLTVETIQKLVTERYELKNKVEKIRQTSARSLWLSDLDAFEKQLDVLDRKDAEAAEKRRFMREKKARKGVAFKAAHKRQLKKTAADFQKVENTTANTEAIAGHASEPVVTKRIAPRTKPANKASAAITDDSEDEVPELKDRFEALNINESTSDHSAMEIEGVKEYQKGKRGRMEPSKAGAAKAAALSSLAPMHHEDEGANFVSKVQNEKRCIMGQPSAVKQPEGSPEGRPKRVRRPTWKVQPQ